MKYSIRILVVGMAVMSVLAGSVSADSFFKQVNHTDGFEMMGQVQPAKNDTSTIWLGDGKASAEAGDGTAILLLSEANQMIAIDHSAKSYSVMSMDFLSALDDEAGEADKADEADEAMAMAQAMMGGMKVEVVPTDETTKIGDWNCRKYNVTMSMGPMMSMTQELWATTEIDIDYDLFNVLGGGMMARMPGFEKILIEMKKIEGMPVRTITTMAAMGKEVKSTMELIEYKSGDAPEGAYAIPEGYKEVEVQSPMGMGMGGGRR